MSSISAEMKKSTKTPKLEEPTEDFCEECGGPLKKTLDGLACCSSCAVESEESRFNRLGWIKGIDREEDVERMGFADNVERAIEMEHW